MLLRKIDNNTADEADNATEITYNGDDDGDEWEK